MRDLLSSLNHGFSIIQHKLNYIDHFDGIFAQEQAETIFGIAFVAAQTYITGTVSDMMVINEKVKLSKFEMLSLGSPMVGQISKVHLINAIANYYKHHEEWSDWNVEGQSKKTIEALKSCGISENTPYPCHKAAQIIWPSEVLCELNEMLDVLVAWRRNLLQHVKSA